MKLPKILWTLSVAGFAAMSSQFAMAGDSGWYVGANAGLTKARIDEDRISEGLLSGGFSSISIDEDERDTGFKLFGGYKFNPNFAIEGGYFDLGRFNFTSTTVPTGTLTGTIDLRGVNVDVVGFMAAAENLSVFARLGVQYAEAKDTFTSTGAVTVNDPNPSKKEANYKFGIGAQYDLSKSLGLRGEWERYRVNDAVGNHGDVYVYSVGLVYMFGQPTKRLVKVTQMVIVPVKTRQYCSILDIQFEINDDDIQREEKEKLAVVGTFLKKYPDTTAVIEGHADSVGANVDNMKLSQRRAEAVVSYLVDTFQIAPARLMAVGYGETRPIGDNTTEEGKRLNRRIGAVIACATDIEGLKPFPARITMAMEMEFDPNRADIRPQYRDDLRKVANFLKANPSVTATVEGHTGNLQPTPDSGMEMSQRRAQNVVNYLVENFGVPRSRLAAQGFGQTRQFAYNTSLEGQQENRRVNIILNYPK